MTQDDQDIIRLLRECEELLTLQVRGLESGELRWVNQVDSDRGQGSLEQLRDLQHRVAGQVLALQSRTVRDPGDFLIDDVMRQAASIRRSDDSPIRVRMSPMDWGKMRRSPNALSMITLGPPPTINGIVIELDANWAGPVTVEASLEKPIRPRKGD